MILCYKIFNRGVSELKETLHKSAKVAEVYIRASAKQIGKFNSPLGNLDLKTKTERQSLKNDIPNNCSVRGWHIRTRIIYTTKSGRISEPSSDINELSDMPLWR